MNIYDSNILIYLNKNDFTNQRTISNSLNYSIGLVNRSLKNLIDNKYLDKNYKLTNKALDYLKERSPKRAIILAAGYGMRMVPINLETPKGLLIVKNERIIERLIGQLHEANIKEIYVVVGFMKESFEYLIDEYGVELIVNSNYASKNNLHSLFLSKSHLDNCYILNSDIYFENNPFRTNELYSWYMVSNATILSSHIRVNRKKEIVRDKILGKGNYAIGCCYLTGEESIKVKNKLIDMEYDKDYDSYQWDKALYKDNKMILKAKLVNGLDVFTINTYEQLRDLDSGSSHLKSNAIDAIKESLNISDDKIENITVLKKGMTNRSFLFSVNNKKYIMRIPGEGTDQLINRKQEANVYNTIKDKNICDNIIYINPNNGYKITEFFNKSKNCDPYNDIEVKKCMKVLRNFHNLNLKVDHEFDIFKQIEFYESLWNGKESIYKDYKETKSKAYELKQYIDTHKKQYSLTHIDAVPDNFLFVNQKGKTAIKLIDWEYSGMQDNDVDIAMFAIYSLYDRKHIDKLIKFYYNEECSKETRIKIYCYIAVCGLLWSNWCEYKRSLGVEFGEYALRQYRYAKDYYKIVQEELKNV